MSEIVDNERLHYLRLVIEAYMRWRVGGVNLGCAEFARVIGMPEPVHNRRVLDLSEDEFTIVDQAFASMSSRDRELIEIEYTRECHPKDKAAECGYGGKPSLAIAHYRRDVREAEVRIYLALQPHLDDWELAKPRRRR